MISPCFKSAICLALLLLIATGACARARILDFHSDIVVRADASMDVTESIRVQADGIRINHGIFRDFPTDYRDRYGNRVHVDFVPISAMRDGVAETFRAESYANGVRVYLGSASTRVTPGEHAYQLTYRTTRQLGFFDSHDELYWNVTGNGWDFAIEHASANIELPSSIASDKMTVTGYTGAQGEKSQNYKAYISGGSRAQIETTRGLAPKQGLTVAVGFPKNIVAAPSDGTKAYWLLRDNLSLLAGIIGVLVIIAYYFLRWRKVGRDPRRGVIFPQYDAPPGICPGGVRYVDRMAYDLRCLAADVVDLAVRGALEIHQEDNVYRLVRLSNFRGDLPKPQADLLQNLLGWSVELTLTPEEHPRIGQAVLNHERQLKKNYGDANFHTNADQLAWGITLSIATGIAMLFASNLVTVGFQIVLMGIVCLTVSAAWFVGLNLFSGWRKHLAYSISNRLFKLFFGLLMSGIAVGAMIYLGTVSNYPIAGLFVLLLLVNLAFQQWLKAPTVEGRKLLDHIEGLRLYLGVAERDELALQKAPVPSKEEYQRFLPYALALDVEQTWGDRFAATLSASERDDMRNMGWYQGSALFSASNYGDFSSAFSASFSSAIAASATPPGSSSGSSSGSSFDGGGSSGGGGGGGGGGGW